MDWFKLAYTLLGGLGIFFFGMKLLSESLQAIGSQWIRKVINTLTSNRVMAVLVGLGVTCFVQSSSITTVMVVGFVNAGLMQLTQAIGVIFGANIGTTITGWIISIKIGKYSLLLIGLGFIPLLFNKNEKVSAYGKVLFALGMVFLGLELMSGAFKPLRTEPSFISLMHYFAADSYFSLWATVAVGCALTFLVQSSSAMLGITIALASSGAITFQTALALVMGENIGTTITALLASVGANVTAKRAAAAHAIFNVLGVVVLTTFFWAYEDFIEAVIAGPADFASPDGSHPNVAAHIAAGHTVFNVANVLIFLPLINHLQKLVTYIIPDKKTKEIIKLKYFGNPSTMSPALAIGQARAELIKMAEMVDKVFRDTLTYLNSAIELPDLRDKVNRREQIADRIQMELMVFLGKVMEAPLTSEETMRIKAILRMADEFESISDYCAAIVNYAYRSYSEKFQFDDATKKEIEDLSNKCSELYSDISAKIENYEPLDIESLSGRWNALNKLADDLKEEHLDRARQGVFPPIQFLTLSDIVVALRRIKNHCVNLAEAYQGGKQLQP